MEEALNIYKCTDTDTICLPVCYPPPIKTYLPISIISNIVTANERNLNWIMSNFIQLYKNKTFNKVESFPIQSFMYFEQASLGCVELNKSVYNINRIRLIEDIVQWIDKKNYVVIYVDEFSLAGMRCYQKTHLLHSQFIFGYNLNKKIFKVINFAAKSGNIQILDIKFEDLEQVFYDEANIKMYSDKNVSLDLVNKGYRIILLKCKENHKPYINYGLDLDIIKIQLKQYLNSENSSLHTSYFTGKLHGIWGICVLDEVAESLKNINGNLDYRILCLLYEHKKYMQLRLELFNKDIAGRYKEVLKKSEIFKNLGLKYIFTLNQELIIEMVRLLNEIKQEEQKLLTEIINY